ncbi:MAG: signal transduction histidine kinase [Clostridiales bacterium]|jgi:signal transduction histidine kinase|nr:signal transduction histidine kinase [Clostridiales bacterium]
MSIHDFLIEKIAYTISMSLVAFLTIGILWILNPVGGPALSVFIGSLYVIGAAIPLVVEYLGKRDFYNNLLGIFDSLDRKNLIAEMINPPSFKEGIILYEIIKSCNKAMLEEINKYKFIQEEYVEYMELWVHEIKTPISSSKLITQNNKGQAMDSISDELERIEEYVEQVLFYSRSNNVEKDYIVKEVNLQKLCFNVLRENSKLFINNNIGIQTENLDENVFSDVKWLQFILSQILTNSVKYSNKESSLIKITSAKMKNSIVLNIEDNGVGINDSEVPRIFDKGFTGTNGRKNERSTGMGLYICKRLCDKLGLGISADSEYGEGTTISIVFPKGSMTDIR